MWMFPDRVGLFSNAAARFDQENQQDGLTKVSSRRKIRRTPLVAPGNIARVARKSWQNLSPQKIRAYDQKSRSTVLEGVGK
jgi:hypothetical protein